MKPKTQARAVQLHADKDQVFSTPRLASRQFPAVVSILLHTAPLYHSATKYLSYTVISVMILMSDRQSHRITPQAQSYPCAVDRKFLARVWILGEKIAEYRVSYTYRSGAWNAGFKYS